MNGNNQEVIKDSTVRPNEIEVFKLNLMGDGCPSEKASSLSPPRIKGQKNKLNIAEKLLA